MPYHQWRHKAYSEGGQRFIEEVIVIDTFTDSMSALRRYSALHKEDPGREYCFFHTSRPKLIARERYVGAAIMVLQDAKKEQI